MPHSPLFIAILRACLLLFLIGSTSASGQVVGSAFLANGQTFHAVMWNNGMITDLGSLGGSSEATGINASGQVVGYAYLADGSWHAFLWTNGAMKDLGLFGGCPPPTPYCYSRARGVNASGQIVGMSSVSGGPWHAVLWNNGGITDLGTLGGTNSDAYGINASGQVVGESDIPGCCLRHAFLWSGGVMSDLGTLGGRDSYAYSINASAQVVGWSSLADGSIHAFLWSNGAMTDLGTLGGNSYAYGINDSSQIVGESHNANGIRHAILWTNGTMTDLGTLGGSLSIANAINASGQVAGSSYLMGDRSTHAFLWSNGVMMDLGTFANSSTSVANGIADNIQFPVGTIGIDLSAKPSSSDWAAIIAASNPQFVIARASGGASAATPAPVGERAVDILNSIPIRRVAKAAYAELNYDDSGPAQIEKALASINTQKLSLAFLAIAVEPLSPSDTFATKNISSRNQIIYEAIQTAQNNQLKAVIYTRDQKHDNLDYWRQITGDTSSFGCLPLWDSLPDQVPSLLPAADLPYGGWVTRAGKQYDIGPNNQGVYPPGSNTSVDLDIFSPFYFSGASAWRMATDLTCIGCLRTFTYDAGENLRITDQPHITVTRGDGPPWAHPVIIQNSSPTQIISGPFSLVLDNLVGGALVASNGTTSCTYPPGSPYIMLSQDHLDPGQRATVMLNFSLTGPPGRLKYDTRVLAGAGTR